MMKTFLSSFSIAIFMSIAVCTIQGAEIALLDFPDAQIAEAYENAAKKNVLAAVNPKVFSRILVGLRRRSRIRIR